MTRYAACETKCAGLDTDFGRDFLFRRFPELAQHILDAFGTYTRGPRKGKQRGYIVWDKIVSGGWVKDGPGYCNGHVAKPGTSNVRVSLVWMGEGNAALYADYVRLGPNKEWADQTRETLIDEGRSPEDAETFINQVQADTCTREWEAAKQAVDNIVDAGKRAQRRY
jgi:hypothetical protein